MENYSYRKPLNIMNTKERCRWYSKMLSGLLPEGHIEIEAFQKAYDWLDITEMNSQAKFIHDLKYIRLAMEKLKAEAQIQKAEIKVEEWHILEAAVKELKEKFGKMFITNEKPLSI